MDPELCVRKTNFEQLRDRSRLFSLGWTVLGPLEGAEEKSGDSWTVITGNRCKKKGQNQGVKSDYGKGLRIAGNTGRQWDKTEHQENTETKHVRINMKLQTEKSDGLQSFETQAVTFSAFSTLSFSNS